MPQLPGNRRQEVVEVVRDPACELTNGLHLLRVPEHLLALAALGQHMFDALLQFGVELLQPLLAHLQRLVQPVAFSLTACDLLHHPVERLTQATEFSGRAGGTYSRAVVSMPPALGSEEQPRHGFTEEATSDQPRRRQREYQADADQGDTTERGAVYRGERLLRGDARADVVGTRRGCRCIAQHPPGAVLTDELERARLCRVDQLLVLVRNAGADEPFRQWIARQDDAVAVGDGPRAAFGQTTLFQARGQPCQVEGGGHHADDPTGLVAQRQGQGQDWPLGDTSGRVLANDEVTGGDRLLEVGAVSEAEIGRRRFLPAGHPTAEVECRQ